MKSLLKSFASLSNGDNFHWFKRLLCCCFEKNKYILRLFHLKIIIYNIKFLRLLKLLITIANVMLLVVTLLSRSETNYCNQTKQN